MLYWGEGAKGRGSASLVNSDLHLLRVFADFLRDHFAVPNDVMRLRCSLFTDHLARQKEIERYWLDGLGLNEASLTRSRVNSYSKYSQRKRTNMLPYGTARLAVHRTQIVQTIYGSIQELGGFDRPAWLG